MAAPKGHPRWGGRKKGVPSKARRTRDQLVRDTFQFGSEVAIPEEILALTPLQIMAKVMHSRYAAGDHAGALSAAACAAPYCHARLSMSEMNIHHSTPNRSDTDIAMEIEGLRRRIEQARVAESPPLIEAQAEAVEPVAEKPDTDPKA
jgi:hypothetical protein